MNQAVQESIELLDHHTVIVVPVYFSPNTEEHATSLKLLEYNVALIAREIENHAHIVLSLDGELGIKYVTDIVTKYGVSITSSKENMGKFNAIANGVKFAQTFSDIKYIVVMDQDGDHFGNELLNFIRLSRNIRQNKQENSHLIIGRRASRHAPMGFLRGELEELADRILLDALLYRAAITQKPLSLEYSNILDEYPDFHSGYKLFTAPLAKKVFLGERHTMGQDNLCYSHHACEAVMVVEAIENGAILGSVNRTTFNEQPLSAFGLYTLSQLVANKIIWPCLRLEVPFSFVLQWYINHSHRLLLDTLTPAGRNEIFEIIKIVAKAYGETLPEDILKQKPLFV